MLAYFILKCQKYNQMTISNRRSNILKPHPGVLFNDWLLSHFSMQNKMHDYSCNIEMILWGTFSSAESAGLLGFFFFYIFTVYCFAYQEIYLYWCQDATCVKLTFRYFYSSALLSQTTPHLISSKPLRRNIYLYLNKAGDIWSFEYK